MHKILIKLKENTMSFCLYEATTPSRNLNNTNVINTSKMVFSDEYINDNLELIESFFNLVVIKNNINTVIVDINAIFPLVYRVIKNINAITTIKLSEDKNVSYNTYEKLLDSKYIKNLECYSMPSFMLDKLAREKDINITTRCEVLYLSDFMDRNSFNSYSDVYYRKAVDISCKMSKYDEEDFESFLNFNNKLKTINVFDLNANGINLIIDKLVKTNKKNIKINLNQQRNSREIIDLTDNFINKNKKHIKANNYKIQIKYLKEYKDKNILKQVNLTFLRVILLIFILIAIASAGIFYTKYKADTNTINDEMEDISELMGDEAPTEITEDNNPSNGEDPPEGISEEQQKKDDKKATSSNSPYVKKFEQSFDKLKKINNETVGWLKVNNTKIDMPITQHSDNEYYLNYSFYKKKNYHGWVFVDYRNDMKNLDRNTVIYGHRNNLGIMFGTLKKVLNKSWYTNKGNQIITFNTPQKAMKWQIFSIYTIKSTNDYIQVKFPTDSSYTTFLNQMKKRSIYNFKVNVGKDDKILTLSTCYKNANNRLVVHAKLIK
ncbi:MAG: class B sortase [Bacilli bacterium]|nr:class B sortase [Bacilli bacterium]